jgi:hypothetical protein
MQTRPGAICLACSLSNQSSLGAKEKDAPRPFALQQEACRPHITKRPGAIVPAFCSLQRIARESEKLGHEERQIHPNSRSSLGSVNASPDKQNE